MPTFRSLRPELTNRFIAAMTSLGGQAGIGEREFLQRALTFDPTEALNRYARGAYDELREQIGLDLRDLAGQAVGAGRLDTGFYDIDRGDILKAGQRQLANRIAQGSLEATSLGLRNLENLGSYATRARENELDLISGGLDRATAEENLRRRRRAALLSALGAVAGGAVGTFALPGVGTQAGAQLGGILGSALGG